MFIRRREQRYQNERQMGRMNSRCGLVDWTDDMHTTPEALLFFMSLHSRLLFFLSEPEGDGG